jgi:SAM-dependent methyltransferase
VDEEKTLVRRGYDALSARYDEAYGSTAKYPWLGKLIESLPPAAAVVDLGCGNGIPVARDLVAAGHRVTGVDFSRVQVRRARQLVPAATFLESDLTEVRFSPASLDAVLAFYSIIHVPLAEQPALLHRVAGWLRPGGLFAATMGHEAWTGVESNWLGDGTPMWWSHADVATNRRWLASTGLRIETEAFLPYRPDATNGAILFVTRRPG